MNNVMTQDEESRTQLSVYRFALASIGYILVAYFAEQLISLSENPQQGYLIAAIIYSIIASVLLFICYAYTKERVESPYKTKPTLTEKLNVIKVNSPLNI